MAAIVGPGGPSMATKSAIDGPGGPVVAGDHLRRDRPCNACMTIAYECIAGTDEVCHYISANIGVAHAVYF